jgi:uncharacterized membrane protein YoaK (UPF0700 family)
VPDTIAFLGLGELFVAHITGNLVVPAAHYVTGGFSQIGPLLSVPTACRLRRGRLK